MKVYYEKAVSSGFSCIEGRRASLFAAHCWLKTNRDKKASQEENASKNKKRGSSERGIELPLIFCSG